MFFCNDKKVDIQFKVEMDLDSVLEETVTEQESDTMGFSEYVDFALENPDRAEFGTAAEYVHEAITHYGTRTVVEDGEKKERYRFFDDPWNDGENAVFGNTEMLNELTDSLRRVARGDAAKMPIIEGETATGKSELTEVMKKGLQHYSQTDEGRIHTVKIGDPAEITPHSEGMWKTYGNPDQGHAEPDDYTESPVQAEPLSLLKELDMEAGNLVEQEMQNKRDKPLPVNIPENTGPVATYLLDQFQDYSGDFDSRRELIDEFLDLYVEVSSFTFDDGTGIGEIKSEDEFDSLYQQLFAEPPLNSDPTNPMNWSFTGAFTAGNRGVAFLDDADQYIQILENLQSQIDDNKTKFHGNGSVFSIDTAAIAISNPEDYHSMLPNSVYRRLIEFEMNYLTNYAVESELLRKMMGEDWDLLDDEDMDPEDALDVIRRPLRAEVMDGDDKVDEVVYSPHTVESAAIFEIASRLDGDEVPLKDDTAEGLPDDVADPLSLMERVQLYQQGFIVREYESNGTVREQRLEKDDFQLEGVDSGTAETSINATFTRDVLSAAMNDERDNGTVEVGEEEFDLGGVVLPYDVLDEMESRIKSESTIKDEEEVEQRLSEVEEHVDGMLEQDVLDAIFHEHRPDEESLEQYVDRVQALRPGEDDVDTFTGPRGEEREPDEFRMQQDEMEFFGFDESDYQNGDGAGERVENFRKNISNGIARKSLKGGFENAMELSAIQDRVGRENWSDIEDLRGGEFENFNFNDWIDQPVKPRDAEDYETDTEAIKNTAVWNMVEHQDYDLPSAILTTRRVIDNLQQEQQGEEQGPELGPQPAD